MSARIQLNDLVLTKYVSDYKPGQPVHLAPNFFNAYDHTRVSAQIEPISPLEGSAVIARRTGFGSTARVGETFTLDIEGGLTTTVEITSVEAGTDIILGIVTKVEPTPPLIYDEETDSYIRVL